MDLVERLERLKRLHTEGTLTDDEFELAKARLLGFRGDATSDPAESVASGSDPSGLRPLHDAPRAMSVRFQAGTPPARLYRAVHRAGGQVMTLAALALEAKTTNDVALEYFGQMEKRGLVQVDDTGEGPARQVVRIRPGAPRLETLPPPPSVANGPRPTLGVWAVAVWLLAWIGGFIGYFALRDQEPARANHVAKWGLIATAVYLVVAIVIFVGALVGST